MIHTLNISYDTTEAYAYYKTLCRDFKHLHWSYTRDHNNPKFIDAKNKLDSMNGWGLQTIYSDSKFPYHCDLDPHDEGPEYFKSTELVFGFSEKLLNFFPRPYRSFLFVHPPNTHIDKWLPSGPPHGKVIIPISTGPKTLLISHDSPPTKIIPVPGIIYLVETDVYTEIINEGSEDDVFLVFNIPVSTFNYIKNVVGQI
jgi:hypothetical protein